MWNRIVDELSAATQSRGRTAMTRTREAEVDAPVRRQVHQSLLDVERFIARHPATCLAAAIGAGIALGWWVKRR